MSSDSVVSARNGDSMKCGALLVLLTALVAYNVRAANWLEKVRETTEEIKQKTEEAKENTQRVWQESERQCVDCGKVIHGRDRCTSCEAKRVSEQANETAQKAQHAWQESERQCIDCGKVIHGRERCTSCESKRLQKGVQEAQRTWAENRDQWKVNAQQTVQSASAAINEFANNPDRQREVVQKVAEFSRDLDITIIKSVPVVDPNTGNIVPFGLMAENMVREAGIGGNFGADPVRCTYMMMIDSDYLFNGAQLIESPSGEYVTLNQAMEIVRGSPHAMNRDAVENAARASTLMRSAYQSGDSDALNRATKDFGTAITALQPHRTSVPMTGHAPFWAACDDGLASLAVSISGFNDLLLKKFQSLGAEHVIAEFFTVAVLVILVMLALVILRLIVTIDLRSELSRTVKALKEIQGLRKSETGTVSTK